MCRVDNSNSNIYFFLQRSTKNVKNSRNLNNFVQDIIWDLILLLTASHDKNIGYKRFLQISQSQKYWVSFFLFWGLFHVRPDQWNTLHWCWCLGLIGGDSLVQENSSTDLRRYSNPGSCNRSKPLHHLEFQPPWMFSISKFKSCLFRVPITL